MSIDTFFAPKNRNELLRILRQAPCAPTILSGCTDFLPRRNGAYWHIDLAVSVMDVAEMTTIGWREDKLWIGAACVHRQIAEQQDVRRFFPALSDACGNVGSPQVRNRGTIGGSLSNSSPAGDIMPALLALNAEVTVLDTGGQERSMLLDDLVLPNGKTVLQPGSVLTQIAIPRSSPGRISAFCKLGERDRVTIAKINAAISLELEHGAVVRPLVTMGAVARRAFFSQPGIHALDGRPFCDETFRQLTQALSLEIQEKIPDRESMPYKRAAIRGVVDDLRTLLQQRAPR